MDCPSPKRSAVTSLPEDAVLEILARVPARSVYRSKCVSKAWRDLIEDPLNRKRLPQTLQGFFFIDKIYRWHIEFSGLPARSVHLQIDSSLSFLMKLPGIEALSFLDSCKGLLLLEHTQRSWAFGLLGYVVCNPATEQWEVVPRHNTPPLASVRGPIRCNYLVFDPSISSHFHLVCLEFMHMFEKDGFVVEDEEEEEVGDEENDGYVHDYWGHHKQCIDYYDDGEEEELDDVEEKEEEKDEKDDKEEEEGEEMEAVSWTLVHVYSSETGKWTHMQSDWSQSQSGQAKHDLEGWHHYGLGICRSSWCAVLNGMLHFIIMSQAQIVAVDVQGATRKIIPVPMVERKSWPKLGYVAQSQGHLHYINRTSDAELFIWVLEDYDAQAWVLKHSVSFMELFGKTGHTSRKNDYSVVAMHPDANVVFIVQNWNLKLVSYELDHKLLTVIGTLENDPSTMHVVPYVPYFSESPALTNKH
ncbi:unnamed protein product [Urochloa humidicola]